MFVNFSGIGSNASRQVHTSVHFPRPISTIEFTSRLRHNCQSIMWSGRGNPIYSNGQRGNIFYSVSIVLIFFQIKLDEIDGCLGFSPKSTANFQPDHPYLGGILIKSPYRNLSIFQNGSNANQTSIRKYNTAWYRGNGGCVRGALQKNSCPGESHVVSFLYM